MSFGFILVTYIGCQEKTLCDQSVDGSGNSKIRKIFKYSKSIANSSFNFFIHLGKTKRHTLFDAINFFLNYENVIIWNLKKSTLAISF